MKCSIIELENEKDDPASGCNPESVRFGTGGIFNNFIPNIDV